VDSLVRNNLSHFIFFKRWVSRFLLSSGDSALSVGYSAWFSASRIREIFKPSGKL
jgi:hypothetical protein